MLIHAKMSDHFLRPTKSTTASLHLVTKLDRIGFQL